MRCRPPRSRPTCCRPGSRWSPVSSTTSLPFRPQPLPPEKRELAAQTAWICFHGTPASASAASIACRHSAVTGLLPTMSSPVLPKRCRPTPRTATSCMSLTPCRSRGELPEFPRRERLAVLVVERADHEFHRGAHAQRGRCGPPSGLPRAGRSRGRPRLSRRARRACRSGVVAAAENPPPRNSTATPLPAKLHSSMRDSPQSGLWHAAERGKVGRAAARAARTVQARHAVGRVEEPRERRVVRRRSCAASLSDCRLLPP